jgi:membrane dipeptidase
MTSPSMDAVHELLAAHPSVDGHNDLAWRMRTTVNYDLDAVDLAAGWEKAHTDIPRLRAGRVGAQFWSVYVPSSLAGDAAVSATLEQIDFVHRLIERYPDVFGLALTADDAVRVFESGRIASFLGAEGGHSIDCSMGTLRSLYRLGVRYMTLTHNDNTPWADAATAEPSVGGLNDFGRAVVKEMNRLGMLIDLAHVAPSTMHDALDATEAPVVITHSACRALVDHPRNVPDDVLQRLAANGGVCMVALVTDFVSDACRQWRIAVREGEDRPRPEVTISEVVAHIEHAREVAGVEHIGIGGDYDGTDIFPVGLEDVSGYPNLFAELLDRGWSQDDCAKLAGGNLLRALRDAESVAERLQKSTPPSLAKLELSPTAE